MRPLFPFELSGYFCDRHQITLLIHQDAHKLAANRERIRRMKAAFWRVQDRLNAAGIEFIVLKGFSNWDRYWADPELRLQYDLDLYCPYHAEKARDALVNIGYESIPATAASPSIISPR